MTTLPGIPSGYRGPAWLRDGRPIYWTGRVAIGIRCPARPVQAPSTDALMLQRALLELSK